jgi:hypothetical protein
LDSWIKQPKIPAHPELLEGVLTTVQPLTEAALNIEPQCNIFCLFSLSFLEGSGGSNTWG